MSALAQKRILLGVSGGIAAYKAAELTRRLRDEGADVRVVMTKAATEFVTPLTFQALSGYPVGVALFDAAADSAMDHIALARWAEVILIAPATADLLARLRIGLADDLLSTVYAAAQCPILLAPAMNRAMWENPANLENVAVLGSRGITIVGPDQGSQACGETGPGRMSEPPTVIAALHRMFEPKRLSGRRLLITAGPTREPIDAVRFLSNRSSGKMGYAVAAAAGRMGADVLLVSGPVALSPPFGSTRVQVETAAEMREAVLERLADTDIFIAAAAVADYAPVDPARNKTKKSAAELSLQLIRTADILTEVAAHPKRPFTVGFAAETDALETYARDKLARKKLDLIAANWVGRDTGGFERDDNALDVFWDGGRTEIPLAPKTQVAEALMQIIADRYAQTRSTQNS